MSDIKYSQGAVSVRDKFLTLIGLIISDEAEQRAMDNGRSVVQDYDIQFSILSALSTLSEKIPKGDYPGLGLKLENIPRNELSKILFPKKEKGI